MTFTRRDEQPVHFAAMTLLTLALNGDISGTIAAIAGGQDGGWVMTPTRLLGRLHPLLLHFPLALVFAAAAVELVRLVRRDAGPSQATPQLLLFAALTAVATSIAGWLNASWEYAGDPSLLLDRHRWLGTIATALLIAVAWISHRAARARPFDSVLTAQRLGAIAAALLVAVVGHLGGELVHGEGYVLKGLWQRVGSAAGADTQPVRVAAPRAPDGATEEERLYWETIRPIFVARCAECHGPSKQKGGLQLLPIERAFDGPRDEWSIAAGFPDGSELVKRLLLPREDADAMPPKGDGLSREDINAIREWIRAGAFAPEREPTDDLGEASDSTTTLSPAAEDNAPLRDPDAVERAIIHARSRGASVNPLFVGATSFDCNASRATPSWSDADLEGIHGLCEALANLNLSHTAVTDEGLLALPPLPRLERIRLDGTAITDRGLDALLASPGLISVNIVDTAITDAGLDRLLDLDGLRQIYVWRSKVTSEGIAAAKLFRPDIEIIGDAPPTPQP